MSKKTIRDLGPLTGKKVLIRVDFNVPLDKKTGAPRLKLFSKPVRVSLPCPIWVDRKKRMLLAKPY